MEGLGFFLNLLATGFILGVGGTCGACAACYVTRWVPVRVTMVMAAEPTKFLTNSPDDMEVKRTDEQV